MNTGGAPVKVIDVDSRVGAIGTDGNDHVTPGKLSKDKLGNNTPDGADGNVHVTPGKLS